MSKTMKGLLTDGSLNVFGWRQCRTGGGNSTQAVGILDHFCLGDSESFPAA